MDTGRVVPRWWDTDTATPTHKRRYGDIFIGQIHMLVIEIHYFCFVTQTRLRSLLPPVAPSIDAPPRVEAGR